MSSVANPTGGTAVAPVQRAVGLALIWRSLRKQPTAIFGMIVAGLMVLFAALAPVLEPYDPIKSMLDQDVVDQYGRPPYAPMVLKGVYEKWAPEKAKRLKWVPGHLLGTDRLGRDVLSRIIRGARISLVIGVLATTLSSAIGLVVGSLSGYFGGKIDAVLMRVADVILAFPFLILLSAIMAIVRKPSLTIVFVVLGTVGWAGISRLVRAQVLTTKERDFVAASRALGAGHGRVLFLHVLPNCISPVVIWFTMGIASAIMAEASLSFLGLGAEEGIPSWGRMIADGQDALTTAWWLSVFPGIVLAFVVLGFNLLGDALQDALNPRLK